MPKKRSSESIEALRSDQILDQAEVERRSRRKVRRLKRVREIDDSDDIEQESPLRTQSKATRAIPEISIDAIDDLSRDEILEILGVLNDDPDAEVEEYKECRLYLYKPNHEVALQFHLSIVDVILAGGGNRSGKSTSAVADFMIGLTGIVPKALTSVYPKKKLFHPQHLRIVSTDFVNGIDKVILPMFVGPKAWFPASMIIGWDSKNRTMLVRNIHGTVSSVEFMSYEQDVEKFQGTSRHRILYDEEPPEAIRKECQMRVIDVDGQEVFSMTPTKGMSWTYDELYEKRGREVMYDETRELCPGRILDITQLVGTPDCDLPIPTGDPDIHFFNFFTHHNPNISQKRVAKLAAKMDATEKSMRMFGQYISFTGRVFNRYDEKLHLVKEDGLFEIPQDWPRYVALDPHPRTPCAVLWVAVDSMGRKWVYDELWTEEACTIPSLATQFLKKEFFQVPPEQQTDHEGKQIIWDEDLVKLVNRNGVWCLARPLTFKRPFVVRRYIDPSALVPNPATGTTLSSDLVTCGVGHFIPGSKDLSRGIMDVNSAFEHNEVFILPHLTRTRYEMRRYVWDNLKQNKDQRNEKQKPKDKDDHFMENLRRIIVDKPAFISRETFDQPIQGSWRRY